MTPLTREQREALAPEDFAVPAQRKLPIRNTPDDMRHTLMAWNTLPATRGLSDDERREARARILARAHDLDIDTSDWDFKSSVTLTLSLQAMSLDMPTDEHPNRMPFSGILTRLDEASDTPPEGTTGKRVFIPSGVARVALPSLLGMGVDTTPEFDGHDAQFKIGVIAEATIDGNAVHIAGFLYASDFPEECSRIKEEKNRLGFSYECKVAISDKNADPWVVDRIIFTGAAILYKDKAAYRTTSLAAKAELELQMNADELKKAIADAVAASLAPLQTKIEAQANEIKDLKAGKGASLAGPIIDQAMPHVGACNACADAMEAAGIGTHPTHGHAAVLRRVGASILHAATMGKLPHIFRDHSYLGGDGVEAAAEREKEVKATAEKTAAAFEPKFKELTDLVAGLKTQLADLKAAAEKNALAPERKTISTEVTALLSKIGLNAETDKDKLTVAKIDQTLEAAGIKGVRAIEAKLKIQAAGLIAA